MIVCMAYVLMTLILFKILALYKSFTYLLTYLFCCFGSRILIIDYAENPLDPY